MNRKTISPVAAHVIDKCGGVKRVAELTGKAPVTIFKWRYDKLRGGTGGLIPSDAAQSLMAAALRGDVDLAPADFFDIAANHG